MSTAMAPEHEEFVDLIPHMAIRDAAVTIGATTSRLSVRAYRWLGGPDYIRVLIGRRDPALIKIVRATAEENELNDAVVHVAIDGACGSRLSTYTRQEGYAAKRYPVTMKDGALLFRLERATQEETAKP